MAIVSDLEQDPCCLRTMNPVMAVSGCCDISVTSGSSTSYSHGGCSSLPNLIALALPFFIGLKLFVPPFRPYRYHVLAQFSDSPHTLPTLYGCGWGLLQCHLQPIHHCEILEARGELKSVTKAAFL